MSQKHATYLLDNSMAHWSILVIFDILHDKETGWSVGGAFTCVGWQVTL